MGRPREYQDRVETGLRLPKDLHDRLVAAAAERDVSVNLLVTKAIDVYLDHLVPVDEVLRTVE